MFATIYTAIITFTASKIEIEHEVPYILIHVLYMNCHESGLNVAVKRLGLGAQEGCSNRKQYKIFGRPLFYCRLIGIITGNVPRPAVDDTRPKQQYN